MSGGKVWVVTGASRGIGASIARVASESGDRVALIARGESVLTLADELGADAMGCSVMWRTQSRCLPRWMR
jgi:3-oxoacyl-[acyl-carrier protein] reductase